MTQIRICNLKNLIQASAHFKNLRRDLLHYQYKPCKNFDEIYPNLHYKNGN